MSMSPSHILSKLKELKKWQEEQQERLLEQHNRHLKHNNFTTAERDFLKNSLGVDITSGINENQSTPFPKFSKKSMQKPLPQNEKNKVENMNITSKGKRAFLRRGAGLARFRMTPGEQFKPFNQTYRNNGRIGTVKIAVNENKTDEVFEGSKPMVTPLKKPKATWHIVLNNEKPTRLLNSCSLDKRAKLAVLKSHNIEDSECQKQQEVNLNTSDRELMIFEALEQRAIQNSFCSTNSSIVRLLSSTPHKNTPSKTSSDKIKENDTDVLSCMPQVCESDEQFKAISVCEQTADKNIYAMYKCNKQTPAIQKIVDDVLQDNAKSINEDAKKFQEINTYEEKLQNEYLNLIEKAIKFKELAARDDLVSFSSSSSVTSEDLERESTLQAKTNFNDEKKWSDFETCNSSTSSVNTSRSCESRQYKCDAETMTDNTTDHYPCLTNEDLLKTKLEKLELELKTIKVENIKINKLKRQLEQQQKEFERHKKEMMKQLEDEKVKINFTLEEERKKLAKEKMVFDRYVKDFQNKPSKKERDEMAALKSEIAALKETLKLKETKNGTAQARLRNQIKSLEKENATLKAEMEKLNRQNGKLIASQRLSRNPSDTKMLHEINKNLTKLAQEQLRKELGGTYKKDSLNEKDKLEFKNSDERALLNNRELKMTPTLEPELEEKENDKNITNNKNTHVDSIETIQETYDRTFKSNYETPSELLNVTGEENRKSDRTEKILGDGTRQIEYKNGNVKTISPDGNYIMFKFYNGDIKETNLLEGTVRYCYQETKVNHTTNADGTESIEFPDGQTERRLKDTFEVQYPNGILRRTWKDDTEEICYPDGTTVTVNTLGEKILSLPNGQKEIHTKDHKRREYPDGTVKILYPDGLQETRYANGRVRLKDSQGKLLLDSHNSDTI